MTFFTVLFCLTSSVGWSETLNDLVKRDGLFYKKFTEVPFTGTITGEEKGKLKNGKSEGSWIAYWENGQLWYKGDYKNGKQEGSWFTYFQNGQLSSKGDFNNGKKEGSWFRYLRDGTVNNKYTGTYKDGIKRRSY